MPDKTILILKDSNPQIQVLETSRCTFGDPFSVWDQKMLISSGFRNPKHLKDPKK